MVKTWTRGQLATHTGCNGETIRYYEAIGLLPEPLRAENGYRQYENRHVERLQFIRRARDLGFGIDDIRALLTPMDAGTIACGEIEKIAKAQLDLIRAKIRDLQRMKQELHTLVQSCQGGSAPHCAIIDALSAGQPS